MSEASLGSEVFDKVTEYIEIIAASLGVAAEHVYTLMVRQMIVEGIVYGITLTVTVVLITIGSVKLVKSVSASCVDRIDRLFECGVIVSIYALIVGVLISNLSEHIMKLLNPEYYVIQEIIKIFGGGG